MFSWGSIVRHLLLSSVVYSTTHAIGGTLDAHGCLSSAGYSYCESLRQCIRVWITPCPDEKEPGARKVENGNGEQRILQHAQNHGKVPGSSEGASPSEKLAATESMIQLESTFEGGLCIVEGDMVFRDGQKVDSKGFRCTDGGAMYASIGTCRKGKVVRHEAEVKCPDFKPTCCQVGELNKLGSAKCLFESETCTPFKNEGGDYQKNMHAEGQSRNTTAPPKPAFLSDDKDLFYE